MNLIWMKYSNVEKEKIGRLRTSIKHITDFFFKSLKCFYNVYDKAESFYDKYVLYPLLNFLW